MSPFSTSLGRVLLVGPESGRDHADQAAVNATLEGQSTPPVSAGSAAETLRWLRHNPGTDLVIIAPGRSPRPYVQLCRSIRFDARSAFLPVVFVLAADAADHRPAVFEAGADDCIQLPASDNEIRLRLAKAVGAKHATDSLEDANAVIASLAAAIEGRDPYTCGHVERVATYSVELGKRVGVDADGLSALRTGGVVHDIGKVVVPDQILKKRGKVTDEEMEIIQRHPVVGHDILRPLRTFQNVVPIVRWHHERPNGAGYPDGIGGDDLPLLPRIAAVADCFDALSTDRPYRTAMPPQQCVDTMLRSADDGDLDPKLVAELLTLLAQRSTWTGGLAERHDISDPLAAAPPQA